MPRDKGFFYLIVQSQGDVNLRRDEGDFTLRPGDLYLRNAEADHQFEFPENSEHLALRVPSKFARQHWPELRNLNFMLYEGRNQPANRLVKTLATELLSSAGDLTEEEIGRSIVAAFEIFVRSVNARQPEHFDSMSSPIILLQRAKRHIATHLQKFDLSAPEVPYDLGISRRYLDRLFEKEGTSASAYIYDLRLSRCAAELKRKRHRPTPISDIAYEWGFRDPSSFSRSFRKMN